MEAKVKSNWAAPMLIEIGHRAGQLITTEVKASQIGQPTEIWHRAGQLITIEVKASQIGQPTEIGHWAGQLITIEGKPSRIGQPTEVRHRGRSVDYHGGYSSINWAAH